jgi:hypothetical protein
MKKHLIVLMLVMTAVGYTSCVDKNSYFYVKNTHNEQITVTISYIGDNASTSSSGTAVHSNITIPANTTKEFSVNDNGYYRVTYFVTSNDSINGRKVAYFNEERGDGNYTIVIF